MNINNSFTTFMLNNIEKACEGHGTDYDEALKRKNFN